MRVLVTGATGMLGRVLAKRLSVKNEVTGVSRSGKERSRVCDLSAEDEVKKLFHEKGFDLVIHTAAYSDVDGCERDPQLAHASNALATKYLAQACGSQKIPFIYVSTDYVFDGRKHSPYMEEDRTGPVNIYGMTKLEGEFHTKALAGVSAIVRTSWLFGPANPNNFVNAIIERLKKEKVVRVLDDQEDSPTYVGDLSSALERIGESLVSFAKKNPQTPRHEIYHFCNAGSTTRHEMTVKIRDLLGLKGVSVEKVDQKELPNRLAIRPAYVVMATRRYEEFSGTKIRDWQESLRDYLGERDA